MFTFDWSISNRYSLFIFWLIPQKYRFSQKILSHTEYLSCFYTIFYFHSFCVKCRVFKSDFFCVKMLSYFFSVCPFSVCKLICLIFNIFFMIILVLWTVHLYLCAIDLKKVIRQMGKKQSFSRSKCCYLWPQIFFI